MKAIRCCYCPNFAQYIFWKRYAGYHHPCCLTCYPKAVKDVGSDRDSLSLDGKQLIKQTEVNSGST